MKCLTLTGTRGFVTLAFVSLGPAARAGAPAADGPAAEEEGDAEEAELSRSLRFSDDQVMASKAARLLLEAEETLITTHAAVSKHEASTRVQEEALIATAVAAQAQGGEPDVEAYARTLRALLSEKQQQLARLAAALSDYEQRCAKEDEARRAVRGVNLPWA